MQRDLKGCTEVLLNSLVKRIAFNKNELISIEDSISFLNEKGYGNLEEFYNLVFSKSNDIKLPRFVPTSAKLPYYIEGENWRVDPPQILTNY